MPETMVESAAATLDAAATEDTPVEVVLRIASGVVDALPDPVHVTYGQGVRWRIEGEDAGRVTLRFEGSPAAGGRAAVRLSDADLGPFAARGDLRPDAIERSGASGLTLHLGYRVIVDGRELPWPPHPETGEQRNFGGLDVEVPPPGG